MTPKLFVIKELEEKYAKQQADGRDNASVYAGLGEKDRTFAWLEKEFQAHSSSLVEIRLEPMLEFLRSNPSYANLLGRMGLPQ